MSKPRTRLAALSAVLFLLALIVLSGPVRADASTPLPGPPAPGETTVMPAAANPAGGSADTPNEPPTTTPQQPPTDPPGNKPAGDPGNDGIQPPAPDGGTVTPPDREPAFVDSSPGGSGADGSADTGDTPSSDPLRVSPLSVPNFLIDKFEIPPFLLPIYQACGTEYGIPWTVLAAINRAETGFGTNLGTSYAGALGWMQFLDSSWEMFGVDANGDGVKDPYNPVDAICAASRYLKIAGYADDPHGAVFAYNHADWYVSDILQHAEAYAKIPTEVISALTGLTEGARFPVAAESSYAGQISTGEAKRKGLASQDVESTSGRTSIEIAAAGGSPVIAVNDGVVSAIDPTGGTVTVTDAYGNRYSYSRLGSVASVHPVPRERRPETTDGTDIPDPGAGAAEVADQMGAAKATDRPVRAGGRIPKADPDAAITEVMVDPEDAARAAEAAAGPDSGSASPLDAARERRSAQGELTRTATTGSTERNTENARGRVYANPLRPQNQKRSQVDGRSTSTPVAGSGPGSSTAVDGKPGDYVIYDGSRSGIYRFDRQTAELQPLTKGSRVIAGTVLGRLAETGGQSSIEFSIQPGGENAPKIDPKPFLDGWRLLAETNIYNARGANRFADRLGVGGVLLLSKPALQRRILSDPGLDIYECGRQDIASGFTDRRILAALAFLRERGFTMMITSLTCGHGINTSSGNVSEHTTGGAVDIAAFNGQVVTAGTQGSGSYTDQAARALMSLQGAMTPHQVISLMDYGNGIGFAMGDHDDHLHVGYAPSAGSGRPGAPGATLGADQWKRLTDRLGEIDNPEVPTTPSENALPADGEK